VVVVRVSMGGDSGMVRESESSGDSGMVVCTLDLTFTISHSRSHFRDLTFAISLS
jgi:hypothetical protein